MGYVSSKFLEISSISVFRSFGLYHIQISLTFLLQQNQEHHVSFIIAFIEISFVVFSGVLRFEANSSPSSSLYSRPAGYGSREMSVGYHYI